MDHQHAYSSANNDLLYQFLSCFEEGTADAFAAILGRNSKTVECPRVFLGVGTYGGVRYGCVFREELSSRVQHRLVSRQVL